MRGRKPAPTALKIAKGVRASRINFHEPKFAKEKDGTPPPMLDALAVAEWNRLFPELKKSGVLCQTDRQAFAAYCHAYSMWRGAVETIKNYPPLVILGKKGVGKTVIPHSFMTPKGFVQQIPAVNIAKQWGAVMLRYAVELGLTPSSHSGIRGIDPDKGKDDQMLNWLVKGKGAPPA